MKMQTLTVASVATVTAMAAGLAMGDSITIDLAGINSNDSFGSLANEIQNFNLGDVTITGIGWDNVVGDGSPTGVSWGNEMTMAVVDADTQAGVFISFFPSEGSASAGGVWGPASSGGIIDLASQGLAFDLTAGNLAVEFFESYDDTFGDGGTDAVYQSGTVTIEYGVPAPGALALLGLAGRAGRRRRRA